MDKKTTINFVQKFPKSGNQLYSCELRYIFVSGMVLIKSREVLTPNEWIHIEASTIAKIGQLIVKVRQ